MCYSNASKLLNKDRISIDSWPQYNHSFHGTVVHHSCIVVDLSFPIMTASLNPLIIADLVHLIYFNWLHRYLSAASSN